MLAAISLSGARAEPLPIASVESADGSRRHGSLKAAGGKLFVTDSAGVKHEVDITALQRLAFDPPRRLSTPSPPLADGPLRAPWASTAVGKLPHGGGAKVSNGSLIIETSAPEKDAKFDSFYMAYRPLPDGDAHITARVPRIDTYEDDTRAGIIFRDGVDPDAQNVYLALSHRAPASVRVWRSTGGSEYVDLRNESRPVYWLRLVRSGGQIRALVSQHGKRWREIWSGKVEFKGPVIAGLASYGHRTRRRWESFFDNVEVGPFNDPDHESLLLPKIALADGNIFHSKIESASPTLLRLGGGHSGRVVPLRSVARIEFFHPLPDSYGEFLGGTRGGLLLPKGDFFESKLSSLEGQTISAQSPLFGKRSFDLRGAVNALVLQPAAKTPPRGQPYLLETWRGDRLYGKAIRIEGKEFVIDTVRLRAQSFPLNQIRRVVRIPPAEPEKTGDS